jgi:hypothetical protein
MSCHVAVTDVSVCVCVCVCVCVIGYVMDTKHQAVIVVIGGWPASPTNASI